VDSHKHIGKYLIFVNIDALRDGAFPTATPTASVIRNIIMYLNALMGGAEAVRHGRQRPGEDMSRDRVITATINHISQPDEVTMEAHISRSTSTPFVLRNFLLGVIKHFFANNGMLLAGGIAYYTLLSIIPALVLTLLFLSMLIDQQRLLETLHQYLTLITPASADSLLNQVRHALQLPQLAGGIGIVSVLIFSGLAFRMLNDAMQVIFIHRHVDKKRHTVVNLVIPYLYVFAIAFSIGLIVTADAAYAALKNSALLQQLPVHIDADKLVSFGLGLSSETLLFMSFYLVMPVGKTPWKHALLGGFSAALLWEATRQMLSLWYSNVSNVNMIYGTFASVVLLLLMIEAGAIILLLGAQVIADYEVSHIDAGLKDPQ